MAVLKKKTEKNDEKVKKNLKNVKFQKCENTGAENGNFGDELMPIIFKTGIPSWRNFKVARVN